MKIVLRILLAPVIAGLVLFVWVCSALLYGSSFFFGLLGTLIGIAGIAAVLLGSVWYGLIFLIVAFLVSPLGLPMLAVRLIGAVQEIRYAIQDAVF